VIFLRPLFKILLFLVLIDVVRVHKSVGRPEKDPYIIGPYDG